MSSVSPTVVTKQPNIAKSATQKGSRGNSKTTKNTKAQSESFSTLGIGELLTICSFLGLKDRLNITHTSTQFSWRTTNLRSLGTEALQQLATHEATLWINKQLQLVDHPIELIQKIENSELTIPDYLCVPITRNILIDQAIEFANTIPDDFENSWALRNISNTLLKLKDIDRAIEVANTIPDDDTKSLALRDISNTLLKLEDIDRAIKVANTIPNDHIKSEALGDIIEINIFDREANPFASDLLASGNIKRAIEIAHTITDNRIKSCSLQNIIRPLLASGNIERAIELANTIPDDLEKSWALGDISKTLLKSGNIERAIELANTIPIELIKSVVLRDISNTLLKSGNIERAIEIAHTIPWDSDKSWALRNIRKYERRNQQFYDQYDPKDHCTVS